MLIRCRFRAAYPRLAKKILIVCLIYNILLWVGVLVLVFTFIDDFAAQLFLAIMILMLFLGFLIFGVKKILEFRQYQSLTSSQQMFKKVKYDKNIEEFSSLLLLFLHALFP